MKKWIPLALVILVLAGCAQTFEGASPSWKAKYTVEETDDSGINRTFSLTYKGDIEDLEAAEAINYSFESESAEISGEHSLDGEIPKDKTFSFDVESESEKVEDETEIVDVMVRMGTELETFQLH
ncbi:hypothetical protein [Sediminibacillus albus]|uniref:Lipoprotein n=1 Tax=Sediminibacillus albus TaxID=407036 RepID=A0A1G8WNT1_9BACI|nr:hypothetical protein [Sediminibacillus albus]SDJ79776.1 hypothetical protein SAMN05216243_0903 [Sediminibacillus albus]